MIEALSSSFLTLAKKTLDRGLKGKVKKSTKKNMAPSYKDIETPMAVLLGEAQALVDGLPALQGYSNNRQTHNLTSGIHGRRKAGMGDDFWQFRPYTTGDDLRSIDWRRSARGDHLYIRQNEWQTAEDIWFWCDPSASMIYRSDDSLSSKSDCAHLLALAAASLFEKGGERLGVLNAHEKPTAGRYGLSRLAEGLEENRHRTERKTSTLPLTPPRAGTKTSQAHIVLISDFLCDEKDLLNALKSLSNKGVQGHLVHIVDPAEIDFPFKGRTLFEGLEDDGNHLAARSEDLQGKYRALMTDWCQNIQGHARHAGWGYTLQRTDEPITKTLLHLSEISSGKGGKC